MPISLHWRTKYRRLILEKGKNHHELNGVWTCWTRYTHAALGDLPARRRDPSLNNVTFAYKLNMCSQ